MYLQACRSDLEDGRVTGEMLKMTRVPELAKTLYKMRGKSILGADEADQFMLDMDK